MRNIFSAAIAVLILLAAPRLSAQTAAKAITLEDIWLKGTFRVASVPGFAGMQNGQYYTMLDSGMHVTRMSLEDDTAGTRIFSGNVPYEKGLTVEDYALSDDERRILIRGGGRPLYRRSSYYRVAVRNLLGDGQAELVDTGEILHATFSPDGTKVAFVRDNNLYYRDLEARRSVAVTSDGKWNHIINGNCDWVYEEEFEFTRAFQWSPDSKALAYYRFDERSVPEYSLAKYTGLNPENYSYKYPKAGEANSVVTIHFYDLITGKKTQAQTMSDGNADHYIPRILWTADPQKLCILKLNRLQNRLDFLLADRATGAAQNILTETDAAYVEVGDNFRFLPDRRSMIYTSERDGFNRLYHYDWARKKHTALSGAGYDVEDIVVYDDKAGQVYFSAATKPTTRALQVVSVNGKGLRTIAGGGGTHAVTVAGRLFLDRYTEANKPPVYRLIRRDGTLVRTLEDNAKLAARMREYGTTPLRMMQIPMLTDNRQQGLNAWIVTPPDFDSTKKYPVLMYQYSGPGSQEVADRFPLRDYFWHQMLAQKGYIVACVDGRGTGYRGRDFKKATYRELGKLESDDQIAAARYLRTLSYVDSSRIGIWGWSYGGFMSSTCLFKAPEVFKMAIAVAPVSNWRYYDNIYTERFMRTPQENPRGYDDNSPVNMVKNLRGKFLLIHGTADDNVHFQNSVELVEALQKAGKQFDFAIYPDKAHSISGAQTRYHLYGKMTDFVLQNL